jgi:ribonucleotide monophosphatase NagD (HAD superfamily)
LAGLQGALVRTGKYRESYVSQSTVKPDLVIDSIKDLPQVLALNQ